MNYLYYKLIFLLLINIPNILSQNVKKQPNIIFIVADDLGWGDIGFHGLSQMKTPNLDMLASTGIILNNYYVLPICSPSRSALLTGYNPIHTGMQHDVIHAPEPWGLPLKYKLLPQYLRESGYHTVAVGKWHQGFHNRKYIPTERGFDSHFGYWTSHESYYDRTSSETWLGIDFRHNEDPVDIEDYDGMYSTEIYTNKTIEKILEHKNSSKPLFLYLAHQAVHAGNFYETLEAPNNYVKRFANIKDERRRTFAGMVSALDDSIGEIFSSLNKINALNETIIIFTTDNGGATGGTGGHFIDNSIGSNWPLRGAKYTLFEGGVRANAFIWSPLLKKSYISNHLMHIQDWLPTIYSAIGGDVSRLGNIDGIDMWNTLNNNLTEKRTHLLHNIDDVWKVWALRSGDYKMISGTTFDGTYNGWYLPPGESLADSSHDSTHNSSIVYNILKQHGFKDLSVKHIAVNCNNIVKNECKPKFNPCLFNVRLDPCEHNNIIHEKPEIVKSMLSLLSVYNSTAVKPLNKPNDPKANPAHHDYRWNSWL